MDDRLRSLMSLLQESKDAATTDLSGFAVPTASNADSFKIQLIGALDEMQIMLKELQVSSEYASLLKSKNDLIRKVNPMKLALADCLNVALQHQQDGYFSFSHRLLVAEFKNIAYHLRYMNLTQTPLLSFG
jgi:hypothetical protein